MKVLNIITGLTNGGAEGSLYRLITSDGQNSHQVISLTDQGVYAVKFAKADIPVYSLNMPRGWITIKGILKLYRLIRVIKPNVIQTWMYHSDFIGGVVAKIAGVKAIVWGVRHSTMGPVHTSIRTRFIAKCCALCSGCIPSMVIFNSKRAAQIHIKKGYQRKKVVVIPNGFDCSKLHPNNAARLKLRKELGLGENDVLLGLIARWNPQKDHANFISALAGLQNIMPRYLKAILVGPGISNDNPELVSLINSYSLYGHLQLLGPRSDILEVMNAIDINILSSSYGEAFPNVLAESMACGTPCVTTDVGDADLIVGDFGWVVPPCDSVSLADSILIAISEKQNEPLAWELRMESCRQRILENFSQERMLRSFEQVWTEAIGEALKTN